jgi:tetratricopeptide (TPR) repeat protein
MESEGRRLHTEAAKAREEGNFNESLAFNEKALFAYDTANDALGSAEGIACRSITLRAYANTHDSRRLLTLAKFEMMASVAIARESGDKEALALPLYNLAKLQEDLDELPDAVATYKEAVICMQDNPPERHKHPSILADMQVHLATCEYKAGDKTALKRAEEALHDLESADEPNKYNADVWVSGSHMRIADALKKDNPEKAREHLQKAKEIIDANSQLTLRRQQWEKLAASFR